MWDLYTLGINHQSPLIYCQKEKYNEHRAGNQSPIPFDILLGDENFASISWESITNPL